MKYKSQKAFTLIEVMIALLIFTIIAAITTGVLNRIFSNRSNLFGHSKYLTEMIINSALFEQDFTQIINRPVTYNLTQEHAALEGFPNKVFFTRSGIFNSKEYPAPPFARISYLLQGTTLIRHQWAALDTIKLNAKKTEQALISNVESLNFMYIDMNDKRSSFWQQKKLPKAIEMNIVLKDGNTITQLYPLITNFYLKERVNL